MKIKTFNTISIVLATLLITTISCKKEEEITTPYNCTANMIADQVAANTTTFTNFSGSPIEGINGTTITIFDSFINENGDEYTGIVNIELIEAQDNKNMLLMGYPTVTDIGELLVSGGISFFYPTDNNGNPLYIDPNGTPPQVTIPNSTNNTNQMTLYTASENLDGEFVWVATGTTVTASNPPNSTFTFPISSTGGVNMDYPLPPCTGNFTVNLPNGYNGSNSTVFLYFTNRNSVIRAYDNEDGNFVVNNMLCSLDSVQFVIISQIEGIREYHVSDPFEIPGSWSYNVTSDDLEIRLCDEALRLSIKDELID
jgi:hypothetical protein